MDLAEAHARMAANAASIKALQTSQDTMLELVKTTATDVKAIRESLRQTDETVQALVDNLGDLGVKKG